MSLPGTNTMLIGPEGTGKTYSLRTLIDAGITPFVLFTEQGMEVLGDIPQIRWGYVAPANPSWDLMRDTAEKVNTMSNEQLAKIGGINKAGYGQLLDVLGMCQNFIDQDGKDWGDISSWGTDRAFVVDGLAGISMMSMDLVAGAKPIKSISDWGVAMDQVERLVAKWCLNTRCHFVLIAHVALERDEVLGTMKGMAATLGQKLAPKLPRFFSDVILTRRDGPRFWWSTSDANTNTKARNVGISNEIVPSFVPLIESWKKHGGVITLTQEAAV